MQTDIKPDPKAAFGIIAVSIRFGANVDVSEPRAWPDTGPSSGLSERARGGCAQVFTQ